MTTSRAAAALVFAAALSAAPAAQDGALPDAKTFLQEVRDNLSRAQQLAHRYTYKERRTDLHMNPFGRLGTGDTRILEVYPSPNPKLTYRRVVERNGVPVPKTELDRQDREYRAEVAAVERRLAREDDDDREKRQRDELLARQRAQMMIQDVVAALQFEVARRERRDGVPVIVITFEGRPDANPVTRQGKIARHFKGNAFIDEARREVVHVEAVATDNISFGGFIAKLYEGTHATLDRREIERGVWMPTKVTFVGQGRALFRRMSIDYAVEWFDYRRVADGAVPTQGRASATF